MAIATTNWNIQKPETGEQDLAESVADAYDVIDGALFTEDEKGTLKGSFPEGGEGVLWDVDLYDGANKNIMHSHPVPTSVPSADHADAAAKVDNKLTITPYSGIDSPGDPVEFDGSDAKSINLSASGHVHNPREFEGYHQIYSGTQAPEVGAPNAEVGDIYIRFVS